MARGFTAVSWLCFRSTRPPAYSRGELFSENFVVFAFRSLEKKCENFPLFRERIAATTLEVFAEFFL